jgi:hypothetical protein
MAGPKIDNSVFEALSESYLLALCIWAEARNQGLDGMQAVGSVILNRAARPGWWGRDIKSVILCPRQFSWLNSNDPQRARAAYIATHFLDRLPKDALLRKCLWVAIGLVSPARELGGAPLLITNVGNADHYHTTSVQPYWRHTLRRVLQLRDHIFYTTV